ncbi:hypothetical protein TcCL_NonESM08633 [Trypanosoma cruzi]|nr:hypothetical protein TcCL_NonESM08633 [Trypanosoma cruzi]
MRDWPSSAVSTTRWICRRIVVHTSVRPWQIQSSGSHTCAEQNTLLENAEQLHRRVGEPHKKRAGQPAAHYRTTLISWHREERLYLRVFGPIIIIITAQIISTGNNGIALVLPMPVGLLHPPRHVRMNKVSSCTAMRPLVSDKYQYFIVTKVAVQFSLHRHTS